MLRTGRQRRALAERRGGPPQTKTLKRMNVRLLGRRYFLVAYWLVLVTWAANWGKYPGLVVNPELAPYPWKAVGVTCGVLAVEVAILYAILRPVTFDRSWSRLGFALLYGVCLLTFSAFTFVTDMPGYYYVPAYFSAITVLALLVFALLLGLAGLLRGSRHAL